MCSSRIELFTIRPIQPHLPRLILVIDSIFRGSEMNRIRGWLWEVADYMDWHNCPPKQFWRRLLLRIEERDDQDYPGSPTAAPSRFEIVVEA
jgi:hypothetical protein